MWLDTNNVDVREDDAMRILKIAEELGEVTQAYIGMTGQNPRKGVTHTEDQVLQELADVVVTALAAIQHFTRNYVRTGDIVLNKIDAIMDRAGL